ncbi:MAG TPA: hypothetical protein VNB94_01885 [Mycobacteriales bacterium]|nr:hypothetical protein [Mycobacteriales bacterium]
MKRSIATALVVTAAISAIGGVAEAKHKKPITKSYTATAPNPDPTNYAGGSVCARNVPGSAHIEKFTAPEAGTLKAEISKFQGDWDMLLLDEKGRELSNSGGSELVDGTEKMTYKFKKPGTVSIIACNWAGGPTAAAKYEFTFK